LLLLVLTRPRLAAAPRPLAISLAPCTAIKPYHIAFAIVFGHLWACAARRGAPREWTEEVHTSSASWMGPAGCCCCECPEPCEDIDSVPGMPRYCVEGVMACEEAPPDEAEEAAESRCFAGICGDEPPPTDEAADEPADSRCLAGGPLSPPPATRVARCVSGLR
jgi:hypothetical protein